MHADLLKGCCDEVGQSKVVAVVTDNASSMRKARELLVATEGYTHIMHFG
jgi:hypothetical protein